MKKYVNYLERDRIRKARREYLRRIMIIAVPILLSNIISQVQMLIDRAFLGHVNSLYMSALGNVNSPIWTTMSFCFTLSTGASILLSQAVGAGKREETSDYAAALIKWNNAISIFLFLIWTFGARTIFSLMGVSDNIMPMCLGYTKYFAPIFLVVGLEASTSVIMQTSNYTTPLIFFGIVRSGLNVILDYVLIFGKFGLPAMGIEGAAIATTIAEYAGCLYTFYIFATSDKLFTRPSLKATLTAKLTPFFQSCKLGVNAALEDFAWNLGNIVLIRILNAIDEMAAGIYSIVFGAEVLAVVVVTSIGNATMTLTSEAMGKRDVKQYTGVIRLAYLLSVGAAVVMLLLCIAFPHQIISIFTKDEDIIKVCIGYMILMCFNLYAKSANIIIGNGIRGSGDTRWMFLTQIFGTVFVIGSALVLVFVMNLGITGVFLAVILDEIVRAFVNLAYLVKIARTKFTFKGTE